MALGFFIFACSLLVLFLALMLWLKPVFFKMRELVVEVLPTHGLAVTIWFIGMVASGMICFRETWQPVTIAQANEFAPWDWMIYLGMPFISMLLYTQGFLNRSLERADKALAEKRSTITSTTATVVTKASLPEDPPNSS